LTEFRLWHAAAQIGINAMNKMCKTLNDVITSFSFLKDLTYRPLHSFFFFFELFRLYEQKIGGGPFTKKGAVLMFTPKKNTWRILYKKE
jgi:hypothetical protein